MAIYKKAEAKEWAREKFRGIENVLMPSLREANLGQGRMLFLDEAGVRHDVNTCVQHGFFSTTVGIEGVPIMLHETVIRPFYQVVKDEAKDRILLDAYICNNTMDEQLNNVKIAEEEGFDCVMVAFSPSFCPRTEREAYEYFERICDSTDLAVVAYPSHKYNFERFHPSRFSPALVDQIAEIENVVAMKLGVSDISHNLECIRLSGRKVMLNTPVVSWWPLFVLELGVQWAGSAPYDYMQTPDNPRLVEHFNLLLDGKMKEAMELYWAMSPARDTFEAFIMPMVETGNYNIMHWKYMTWLTGMNGGPVPLSTARLYEHEKARYRDGLIRSGISPREPDEEFYVGRVNYR